MAVCINKNSIEYQSLKLRAGISEFILEAVCRDFMEKYDRFPHLDELPNSNSELYLRDTLKVKENGGANILHILEVTGKETIEEAVVDLNNTYRDLETKILPIEENAIVDIVHRPSETNLDNISEEDMILANASRDSVGNLLAPNGKVSNLTEKLYAQVRTKAFKNWFGDWINNPSDASKVVDENGEPLVVYHSTSRKDFGFTEIDFSKSDDKQTFFTTDNKYMSQSYTLPYEVINGDDQINSIIERALNINLNSDNSILPTVNDDGSVSAKTYRLIDNIPEVPANLSSDLLVRALDAAIDNRYLFLLEAAEVKYFTPDSSEIFNLKFEDPFAIKSDKEVEKILINRHNSKIEDAKRDISEFEDAKYLVKKFNIRIESNFRNSSDFPIYGLFMNLKNPLIYDNEYVQYWNSIKFEGKKVNTRKLANIAKERGYDGVIIKKINDFGPNTDDSDTLLYNYTDNPQHGTICIAMNKVNQVKSATSNSGSFNKFNRNIYDTEPIGYFILNNALQKLGELYGIKFNETSDAELNSDKWKGVIPDASLVNAFIYNGQIYINLDRADLDAPIHEMFHILVGSMRFEQPQLYKQLIDSVESFYNYPALIEQYPGRSRNDVNEEIFVTELANYFAGLPSELINLDLKALYELRYNIKRTLDTILMGSESVKTITDDRLYNMSLKELVNEVNSSIMTSKFKGFINVEGSELHRKLNNIKSDLLNKHLLEELCD